jgi:pyridinium-3,5-bisthiocarboxylic acid mononucleotide nickel chelatase
MSKVNLYIDCTNGISGDMLCRCLTDLCDNPSFVEEQQQLVSDELHHEAQHQVGHDHAHAHGHKHEHSQPYTHRSFQSILGLLATCQLDDNVKAVTLKIYTILAAAEAEVHGETLETVHFHEVGRPQAIINIVGIAAAFIAINPKRVHCSKVMDGTGTVHCAHGEISVPVPAVKALMKHSELSYGTKDVEMEMVTPTGLAALLGIGATHEARDFDFDAIVKSSIAYGTNQAQNARIVNGLKGLLLKD